MNEILIPNLGRYADRHELELAETLGSGKDGIVLVARRKAQAGKVAVKALRWPEAYEREHKVYERLKHAAVSTLLGFNVPQLLGADAELRILEMTIVERSFVLDFAGAHLDARPQFPEEVWRDWEAEKREQFEARWPEVRQVLDAFEELGIFLLDVSPGNIAFLERSD
jgi:hypothetical protein